MKKVFLSVAMLCASLGVFAQTPTAEVVQNTPLTSRGFKILPEKGDFAIGVDATPFLQYIGNSLNGTQNNQAPFFGDQMDFTLRGKYFLEDNRAIRLTFGWTMGTLTQEAGVQDDEAVRTDPTSTARVFDKRKIGETRYDISAGYEFRRGYRRLQGFYGGELGINYINTKDVYTYANDFSSTNTTPTSTDFNTFTPTAGAPRVLEINQGAQFGVSLSAFAGVEYFVASKLSIGGEVGLGFGFLTKGKDKTTSEGWNATSASVEKITIETNNGTTGAIAVSTLSSGRIFVMFHF